MADCRRKRPFVPIIMKRFLFILLALTDLSIPARAQQIYGPVQTSAYSRQLLTNDNYLAWLTLLSGSTNGASLYALLVGTNNFAGPNIITNPANVFAGSFTGAGTNTLTGPTSVTNFSSTFQGHFVSATDTPSQIYGSLLSPSVTSGASAIMISNGAITFPGDSVSRLFANTNHGTKYGNNVELQFSGNQLFFGVTDGNHIQIGGGLAQQTNIQMYMQYAIPTTGQNSANQNGQSHMFGWAYDWNYLSGNYFGYWMSKVTNINYTNGYSELQFYGPNGTGVQDPDVLGPKILTVGQDGSIQPSQIYRGTLAYPTPVGITNWFLNYTNAEYQEWVAGSNVFVIETNLYGITNGFRKDVVIDAGWSAWAAKFPANWIVESESGTNVAPTNILANTKLHVRLTATMGVTTNILAHFTSGTYTPQVDAAASNFWVLAGVTSTNVQIALNQFVLASKSHGYWSKGIAGYPFIGGTSTSTKWNLFNTNNYAITWHGSPTFDAFNGVTGDGSAAYGDTGLVPATALASASDSSCFVWVRSTVAPTDGGYFYGVTGDSPNARWGYFRNGTFAETAGMNAASVGTFVYAYSSFTGLLGQNRTSASAAAGAETVYLNGIAPVVITANAAIGLPTVKSLYLLARNNDSGTADAFSNVNLSSAWVFEGMNSGDVANLNSDLAQFNAIIGR